MRSGKVLVINFVLKQGTNPVYIKLCKVAQIFKFVDESLVCDHSNDIYRHKIVRNFQRLPDPKVRTTESERATKV